MGKHINYGIIGCGMMGQEHLRNIALLANTTVLGIIEPDPGMQAEASKLAPDAHFHDSIESLLADERLDCLVIVSPNFCHADQLLEIARRRSLPILVEKPLFTHVSDIVRLQDFEKNYPAPVWVAMEYRYMPAVTALIENAPQDTGGIDMLTIREHRFAFLPKIDDWNRFNVKTGGTLVEKCCHFFDLMRLILQSDPVRVMASAGQGHNHTNETYDGQIPDIWDHGYVIIEFASGSRAMLELCMFAEGSRYQEEISAVGVAGKIECQVPGPTRFWAADLGAPPIAKLTVSPRNPPGPRSIDIPVDPELLEAGDHNGSTFYQHQKFADVVRGHGAVEVSIHDGMMAVIMGMAAQHAATTHETVLIKDILDGKITTLAV
ncbi:Gfo/Idh/MocA family protein [Candidatus Puniceispirillum marinum]|uniref:Oxidoreductase-like protein n=1 Tax=Puniceispirillum marinum (strain IMCC1322) TaxID=488538 RepID=D5BPY9_PUNMI|nr:Gfo/Idh/MocA family oxidoreductase [Candidatus Puniceispirillum marinum]ADE38487.1 oxidoreductase-like protein [Candidatus Puniceispirillum marinum IMCC1322]